VRSAIIIAIGLAVLGVFLLAGRYVGSHRATSMARAALLFLPVWLVAAGINLWAGVARGYSVLEEAPIFFVIFTVPAAVALIVWRRLTQP
jgi:hypothetical protein